MNKLKYKDLTEKQIRKYMEKYADDKEFWGVISSHQDLSENFIREFQDHLDWGNISTCQELSENFIFEFKDKLNWENISRFKFLREEFIDRVEDKIHWNYLTTYRKFSEQFIEKHIEHFEWEHIFEYQTVSEDFMKKHKKEYWNSGPCLNKIRMYQKISHSFNMEILRQQQKMLDVFVKMKYYKNKTKKRS